MSTIRDLAKKANVSITTVSKIMNNDPNFKVKPETRELVLKCALELDYKSNTKCNNSFKHNIAIIQWYTIEREHEDTFYLDIRKAIEAELKNIAYEYTLFYSNDKDYLSKLKNYNGIICIGKFSDKQIANYRKITNNIVIIDMELSHIIVSTIVLDYKNAIIDVLNHLISKNHRNIGFLAGNEVTSDNTLLNDPRKKFFLSLAKSLDINYKNYYVEGYFTEKSGYSMMKTLIEKNKVPTAIICASDSIAIGAIKALNEYKYCVPEDVSIIGFNNDEYSLKCVPPLSTIHVPTSKMGKYGVLTLINHIDKIYTCPVKIELPCELLLRKSTK